MTLKIKNNSKILINILKYIKPMELAHTEAENTIKKPSRNLGIEMLRMFLCFRIVLLHYCSPKNKIIKSLKRNRFQVSCFFLFLFISYFQ